jgi:PKD repeat protein
VYNRPDISNSFPGYINEVRIWNIEKSQNDLRKYMTNSLPNPTTTKGLIGYYLFDNLINKQGNTRFNGQLHGKAQIKKNNPNCILNTDSCEISVKKENVCIGERAVSASFSLLQSTCFQFNFENLSSDKNNEINFWQFGDGKTSTKKSVVHNYTKPGNYTTTLIVKNKYGCADTMVKKVRITLPNNAFTYKTNEAFITLTANNKKLQNSWYFGDNTPKEEGATITHAFKQPGDYTVILTSTDQLGCTSTKSQTISIANAPVIGNIEIALPTIENKAMTDANLQLVQKINQRVKNVIQTIPIANDSIAVYFYDNAEIDGDSITISFNNFVIEKNLLLSAKGKKYILHLDKTLSFNELVMYAENQGSIPPNTALMLIYDGEKRYELHITSTDNTNGTVVFTFNKK